MASRYTIAIPDERLATIKSKIDAYDWNQLPDAGGWQSGVGVLDLRRLVDHWRDAYDWRKVEQRLNQLPNFVTEVEGERIHFLHATGDSSRPPLLLLHGWPGSFLEFEALLESLVADGHDVVVPSLPGFAFSNPLTSVTGPRRVAQLMHGLMTELYGSTRYIVQGGDWGAGIAGWMAYLQPDRVLGIHLNMVGVSAKDSEPTTTQEKEWSSRRSALYALESGYSHEQGTRPQTLGVAMADSPVGVAAWILEKFGVWSDLPKRDDGSPEIWSRYSEESLLTNIMLYIAPSSVVTATWIYRGQRLEGSDRFPAGTRIRVPTGIAAFPDPVFVPPPRSYAEKTYNVVHWTEMVRGGHFAALEEPELMLSDLRQFIGKVSGPRA